MTDDTRRHWKGEPGARHEHANPWGHGGAKGPAARAPWALTPEMMTNLNNTRRDSDTSTSSQNATAEPTSPQTVSERRRSSSGAGLFSNLQTQKRDSSDAGMAGRRASWNEQREQGGVSFRSCGMGILVESSGY
ncbi:hypothetical protein N7448_002411 [Penicillium atrosanguineum]|nr:hypothetical protein N7448_002411 [Penicillium atrosanguineum]